MSGFRLPRAPRWVRRVLGRSDLEAVRAAIAAAEARTAAEVRVHLDARCDGDPLARARRLFQDLGLTGTAGRTGILVYVALESRRLALVGDRAVDERMPAGTWQTLADDLARRLGEGRAADGLIAVLAALGDHLASALPRSPDDRNELADDVSLG